MRNEKGVKHYIKNEYARNEKDKLVEILEVWESFSGWYWFITEKHGVNGSTLDEGYAYGLVIGFESEWGEIYLPELEELAKKYKVWKVKDKDVWSISHVITKYPEELKN